MDTGEFESLAKKVEQAVTLIEDLKRERDGLKSELHGLREELNRKSDSMSQAGDRVRDLVSRLELALA